MEGIPLPHIKQLLIKYFNPHAYVCVYVYVSTHIHMKEQQQSDIRSQPGNKWKPTDKLGLVR